MTELRDPFKHDHGGHDHEHDHDHDHDEGGELQQIDPALQSLSDALRLCFTVLRWFMVIVIVVYACSNIFNVAANEQAVRLRFGKMAGAEGQRIIPPGGPHLALPFPIEEVIRIPGIRQQVDLDKEFWFEVSASDAARGPEGSAPPGPLNPEKIGSLLTGDANIVHARITFNYLIIDAEKYLQNVGDLETARKLASVAVEEAVVHVAASATADELIRGQFDRQIAARHANGTLERLESGLKVEPETLTLKESRMPNSVREAFLAVANAESEAGQQFELAQRYYRDTLGATAGAAYEVVWKLVEQYQDASARNDKAAVAKLDVEMNRLFSELITSPETNALTVSGKVAEVIQDAQAYRNSLAAKVESEAQLFTSLHDQYRNSPGLRRIIMDRLWQSAREQILTGDIETFYLPKGRAYIDIGRDPEIRKKREAKKIKDEQDARAAASSNLAPAPPSGGPGGP